MLRAVQLEPARVGSTPALCSTGTDFYLVSYFSPGSFLQTACCAIYGQKELQEFLPSLWSSLRREVSTAESLTSVPAQLDSS